MQDRLHPKERVLGVFVNNDPIAFTFNSVGAGLELAIEDINGQSIIVAASADANLIVAFKVIEDKGYEPIENEFPSIMKDSLGNEYNLFGEVINGPAEGTKLEMPTQFMGYWFSWGAFYEELDLIELKSL